MFGFTPGSAQAIFEAVVHKVSCMLLNNVTEKLLMQ